jgi:methyl-accepting chemotaxis protein
MPDQTRIKRKQKRRAVYIQVQLNRPGQQNLRCTLVDVSETGARLAVKDVTEVPDRFTIVMTARGVPYRKCRLVWRGANEVGVSFESDRDEESTARQAIK